MSSFDTNSGGEGQNPPQATELDEGCPSPRSGLAGLVSRFAAYRDQQDGVDDSDNDVDVDDDSEGYGDDDSSSGDDIPLHPQAAMIQRLLDARASAPPDRASAITDILNSLNLGFDFTPIPRVLKTHVFGPSHTPPTIEHVASLFSPPSGPPKFLKVLVLTGAGVSVAAGIPDFRTPGTGLYDNLEKVRVGWREE